MNANELIPTRIDFYDKTVNVYGYYIVFLGSGFIGSIETIIAYCAKNTIYGIGPNRKSKTNMDGMYYFLIIYDFSDI